MRAFGRLMLVMSAVLISGSRVPAQTTETFGVMRDKLARSERVLEALMTANFAMLQRESAALADATRKPGWAVLKTPQYIRYSNDFVRAAEGLVEAAKERDLDSAALGYTTMTTSCYQCHRYLRRARIAK